MKDKFILDSSVWVAIERKVPKVTERVLPLFAKNQVCLVDLIAAEVLRGTKTRQDFNKLSETFSNFRVLSTSWLKVADLAFEVARRGFHPPLADVYIAQCAIEHHRTLLTQDRDFPMIAAIRHFAFKILS